MTAFDPAAWVTEYERLGGRVDVMRWAAKGDRPRLWLGLTYPRDPVGYAMLDELNKLPDDPSRRNAVLSWVAESRGVLEASAVSLIN